MQGEGRVRRVASGISERSAEAEQSKQRKKRILYLRNCLFSETASNYALEWFSEAGRAPIRSAEKFYFDIDVRGFFQTFSKNIFD